MIASFAEVQNNFGKYLEPASEQEIGILPGDMLSLLQGR